MKKDIKKVFDTDYSEENINPVFQEALKPWTKGQKILIIDIETTGFSHSKESIVEIGIVELDLISSTANVIYNSLCREENFGEHNRDAWIFQNSNLKFEDVMNAKPLDKFEIQLIIDTYPLGATAFNNRFDFGFMEDRGFKFPVKLDCPMLLSTDVCKIPGKYGKNKWPTAQEAYNHFYPNDKYIEKHRGVDDALHEAGIVYALYSKGIFKV